ncbi:hypothetical protein [Melittangium boletus]|uniref:hypothetical protein n=1 Tax=Melittangium boletus TaxID=83453 RepID=UPI003DA5323A
MTPPPESASASASLLESLQRVAPFAVSAGLTPLIPVPFLDDYALRRVREALVRDLLDERALTAPPDTVATLAGRHPRQGSRVQQFLAKVALMPVRLIARKGYRRVLTALWVKDCVDMASVSLHHGHLLRHALARGDLTPETLATPDAARRVHAAILATCQEVDARPVNQALRRLLAGSRLVLQALSRRLESPGAEAPAAPDDTRARASLARELAAVLWEQEGYFQALERRYQVHWDAGAPSRH